MPIINFNWQCFSFSGTKRSPVRKTQIARRASNLTTSMWWAPRSTFESLRSTCARNSRRVCSPTDWASSSMSPFTNAHLPPMFRRSLRSRGHIHLRRAPRPRARQLARQRRLGGGHTYEAHRCLRRLCLYLGSSGGLTRHISHGEREAHARRALPAHLRDASARRDGASGAPSGLCSLTYSAFVHHFTLYVQFVYLLLYIICTYFTYGRENHKL